MLDSRVKVQGFSCFEGVDVFSHRHRDFALQYVYEFFALVVITDTLMRLLGLNRYPKGLQVFVFGTRG